MPSLSNGFNSEKRWINSILAPRRDRRIQIFLMRSVGKDYYLVDRKYFDWVSHGI